jgi:hypothetical protein
LFGGDDGGGSRTAVGLHEVPRVAGDLEVDGVDFRGAEEGLGGVGGVLGARGGGEEEEDEERRRDEAHDVPVDVRVLVRSGAKLFRECAGRTGVAVLE